MDWGTLEILLRFGLPLAILIAVYFLGSWIERRHFAQIARREHATAGMPTTNFETAPEAWRVCRSELVSGNVVVSLDYFKRVIAGLRAIFGGRVKTYEPLMDRARREAILRMKESARELGLDAVINVRIETSRLANARGNGEGTAGVEVLAFGTGLALERQ